MGFTPEEAAEFDEPETIDGVSHALQTLGHEVIKIGHVRSLLDRLGRGERWDLVFNICEGTGGLSREARVPAILDVYEIPYVFSDPLAMSLTLHKGLAKRVVRDLGIPTAPFYLVNQPGDISGIDLPFPLFVKPVAEGTGKGIGADSKVWNQEQLSGVCKQRLEKFRQPVLVERFLPGRELTVGIVGSGQRARVIGMMEVLYKENEATGIYSLENKARYEEFIHYRVPEKEVYKDCEKVALDSWAGLGCVDGGRVDLRLDEYGIPNFMEVNPLPGLHPEHSDLPILAKLAGIGFNELIGMILGEALIRVGILQDGLASIRVPETMPLPENHHVPDVMAGPKPFALILHSPLAAGAGPDELDVLEQATFFRNGLSALGYRVETAPFRLEGFGNPDLVVNLVETLAGSGRLVHVGPALFEAMHLSFTGCSSEAIYQTSNKLVSKKILREHGISTPEYILWDELSDGKEVPHIPFLVKSIWEHASFGMDESRKLLFTGRQELTEGFSAMNGDPAGFFAEEYIDGREFNLSVIGGQEGPIVLPPAEIRFRFPEGKPKIVGYRAKWEESSFEYQHTVRSFSFSGADEPLLDRMKEISLYCWKIFKLKGYARVDFRVDASGRPFVLEINANPCISADSGFVAACLEGGLTPTGIVRRIIEDADVQDADVRDADVKDGDVKDGDVQDADVQ
jgi:D-alanine-D-alanine ligase